MDTCSHVWNNGFEDKCLCTKCSINHDWIELDRQVVTEIHGHYNPSGGASYDFTGATFEEEVVYIAYRCGMCGKQKEVKISFR